MMVVHAIEHDRYNSSCTDYSRNQSLVGCASETAEDINITIDNLCAHLSRQRRPTRLIHFTRRSLLKAEINTYAITDM